MEEQDSQAAPAAPVVPSAEITQVTGVAFGASSPERDTKPAESMEETTAAFVMRSPEETEAERVMLGTRRPADIEAEGVMLGFKRPSPLDIPSGPPPFPSAAAAAAMVANAYGTGGTHTSNKEGGDNESPGGHSESRTRQEATMGFPGGLPRLSVTEATPGSPMVNSTPALSTEEIERLAARAAVVTMLGSNDNVDVEKVLDVRTRTLSMPATKQEIVAAENNQDQPEDSERSLPAQERPTRAASVAAPVRISPEILKAMPKSAADYVLGRGFQIKTSPTRKSSITASPLSLNKLLDLTSPMKSADALAEQSQEENRAKKRMADFKSFARSKGSSSSLVKNLLDVHGSEEEKPVEKVVDKKRAESKAKLQEMLSFKKEEVIQPPVPSLPLKTADLSKLHGKKNTLVAGKSIAKKAESIKPPFKFIAEERQTRQAVDIRTHHGYRDGIFVAQRPDIGKIVKKDTGGRTFLEKYLMLDMTTRLRVNLFTVFLLYLIVMVPLHFTLSAFVGGISRPICIMVGFVYLLLPLPGFIGGIPGDTYHLTVAMKSDFLMIFSLLSMVAMMLCLSMGIVQITYPSIRCTMAQWAFQGCYDSSLTCLDQNTCSTNELGSSCSAPGSELCTSSYEAQYVIGYLIYISFIGVTHTWGIGNSLSLRRLLQYRYLQRRFNKRVFPHVVSAQEHKEEELRKEMERVNKIQGLQGWFLPKSKRYVQPVNDTDIDADIIESHPIMMPLKSFWKNFKKNLAGATNARAIRKRNSVIMRKKTALFSRNRSISDIHRMEVGGIDGFEDDGDTTVTMSSNNGLKKSKNQKKGVKEGEGMGGTLKRANNMDLSDGNVNMKDIARQAMMELDEEKMGEPREEGNDELRPSTIVSESDAPGDAASVVSERSNRTKSSSIVRKGSKESVGTIGDALDDLADSNGVADPVDSEGEGGGHSPMKGPRRIAIPRVLFLDLEEEGETGVNLRLQYDSDGETAPSGFANDISLGCDNVNRGGSNEGGTNRLQVIQLGGADGLRRDGSFRGMKRNTSKDSVGSHQSDGDAPKSPVPLSPKPILKQRSSRDNMNEESLVPMLRQSSSRVSFSAYLEAPASPATSHTATSQNAPSGYLSPKSSQSKKGISMQELQQQLASDKPSPASLLHGIGKTHGGSNSSITSLESAKSRTSLNSMNTGGQKSAGSLLLSGMKKGAPRSPAVLSRESSDKSMALSSIEGNLRKLPQEVMSSLNHELEKLKSPKLSGTNNYLAPPEMIADARPRSRSVSREHSRGSSRRHSFSSAIHSQGSADSRRNSLGAFGARRNSRGSNAGSHAEAAAAAAALFQEQENAFENAKSIEKWAPEQGKAVFVQPGKVRVTYKKRVPFEVKLADQREKGISDSWKSSIRAQFGLGSKTSSTLKRGSQASLVSMDTTLEEIDITGESENVDNISAFGDGMRRGLRMNRAQSLAREDGLEVDALNSTWDDPLPDPRKGPPGVMETLEMQLSAMETESFDIENNVLPLVNPLDKVGRVFIGAKEFSGQHDDDDDQVWSDDELRDQAVIIGGAQEILDEESDLGSEGVPEKVKKNLVFIEKNLPPLPETSNTCRSQCLRCCLSFRGHLMAFTILMNLITFLLTLIIGTVVSDQVTLLVVVLLSLAHFFVQSCGCLGTCSFNLRFLSDERRMRFLYGFLLSYCVIAQIICLCLILKAEERFFKCELSFAAWTGCPPNYQSCMLDNSCDSLPAGCTADLRICTDRDWKIGLEMWVVVVNELSCMMSVFVAMWCFDALDEKEATLAIERLDRDMDPFVKGPFFRFDTFFFCFHLESDEVSDSKFGYVMALGLNALCALGGLLYAALSDTNIVGAIVLMVISSLSILVFTPISTVIVVIKQDLYGTLTNALRRAVGFFHGISVGAFSYSTIAILIIDASWREIRCDLDQAAYSNCCPLRSFSSCIACMQLGNFSCTDDNIGSVSECSAPPDHYCNWTSWSNFGGIMFALIIIYGVFLTSYFVGILEKWLRHKHSIDRYSRRQKEQERRDQEKIQLDFTL